MVDGDGIFPLRYSTLHMSWASAKSSAFPLDAAQFSGNVAKVLKFHNHVDIQNIFMSFHCLYIYICHVYSTISTYKVRTYHVFFPKVWRTSTMPTTQRLHDPKDSSRTSTWAISPVSKTPALQMDIDGPMDFTNRWVLFSGPFLMFFSQKIKQVP